jgi:peptide/nickel transport system substrate-binding protein
MGAFHEGQGVTRRQLLGLLAGAAVAVPSRAAAQAAKTPRRGGVLRLAHTSDIIGFDPTTVTAAQWPMFAQVYNVLVRLDGHGKAQPELAESWQFSRDYRTLTLKLRQGVRFHSGRELTAEDVVWNFKRVQDPNANANVRQLALAYKTVEAKDRSTVVVAFESFFAAALDVLDAVYIMDPKAEATIKTKGAGTGPFKVDSWRPGDHVRLMRNEHYWRPGRPYLDEVILRAMPDEQAMVIALESGQVDLAEAVPVREWVRLQKSGRLNVIQGPIATIVAILYNVAKPPLDNKKARQAIAAALDRQKYIDLFVAGASTPYCLGFPPTSLAWDPQLNRACLPDFDLARAKQLLTEAGHPNGFEITLLTSVPGAAPYSKEIAEKLQADLRQIGIRANILQVEAAENARRLFATDYELASSHFARFQRDPATLFGASRNWQPDTNLSNFRSPEYTRLVKEAGLEPDPGKRKELYRKISLLALDEVWISPLFPRHLLFAAKPTVHGLAWNLDGFEVLEEAWLEG